MVYAHRMPMANIEIFWIDPSELWIVSNANDARLFILLFGCRTLFVMQKWHNVLIRFEATTTATMAARRTAMGNSFPFDTVLQTTKDTNVNRNEIKYKFTIKSAKLNNCPLSKTEERSKNACGDNAMWRRKIMRGRMFIRITRNEQRLPLHALHATTDKCFRPRVY